MASEEYCPLPDRSSQPADVLGRMMNARRIAVVGLSDDPARASNRVAAYLHAVGREIIPVNPAARAVFGIPAVASLDDIAGEVDLVNVFRRAEFCPDVVRSAVKIGAKGVWLQSGIVSAEAEGIARQAGIDFTQDRCLMVELMYRGDAV